MLTFTGPMENAATMIKVATVKQVYGLSFSRDARKDVRDPNSSCDTLQPVDSLVDPTLVDDAISDEENDRRKRLKILLAAKDPKVEQTIVARRAVSLLEQAHDSKAVALLERLANRDADDELGTIARNALKRCRISAP